MEAENIPKGMSAERQGDGSSANKRGIYRHEKSGATIVVSSRPAADAVVRQDFVYVGPATSKADAMKAAKAEVSATQKAQAEVEKLKADAAQAKADAEAAKAEAVNARKEAEAKLAEANELLDAAKKETKDKTAAK